MPKINQPESAIPGALEGLHLFHYDGAPCAQRVRFVLGEKGLARGREEKFDAISPAAVRGETGHWVSRLVSLPMRHHMTETYAKIHPNMVVPALVHNGDLYLESLDIIEYLDEAFEGPRLIPGSGKERVATMRRVDQAKALHKSIRFVTFRWGLGRLAMLNAKERHSLSALAKKGSDDENLVAFYDGYSNRTIPESVYMDHLACLHTAFCEINTELTDGRQFLISDEVSIADAFWAMKILRLLECGYPVEKHHPVLYAWYQRVCQRPSFQNEVMGKNRLGNLIFRIKSRAENLFGIGLESVLNTLTAKQHDGGAGDFKS